MTNQEKADRVAGTQGYAPAFLLTFDDAERAAIAALCDDAGQVAPGTPEKFAAILEAARDRLASGKATHADLDETPATKPSKK